MTPPSPPFISTMCPSSHRVVPLRIFGPGQDRYLNIPSLLFPPFILRQPNPRPYLPSSHCFPCRTPLSPLLLPYPSLGIPLSLLLGELLYV